MKAPLLLFSCCSKLAYSIAEKHYDGFHYAWCSPFFDVSELAQLDQYNPPSSNPKDIYHVLQNDVQKKDLHSSAIRRNRLGIRNGIDVKERDGIITNDNSDFLREWVDKAETSEFTPLLLIMPYKKVAKIVKEVPMRDRAHPLSQEYLIDKLPSNFFTAINF